MTTITQTGKKIWLLGASEGIGEALAKQLANSGAQLALSARNEEKLKALAKSLYGTGHIALPLDVTKHETVEKAWHDLTERWGSIDTVIYNAGTYDPVSAKEFNLQKAEHMLDVNFRGALRVLDSVLPGFVSRKAGHIVLVGSVAGYRGLPKAVGYGASKAALNHLAQNLRVDLDPGTKVQIVNPGFVRTRLTDQNDFHMPFMLEVDDAAGRIVSGMNSSLFEIHFPHRFSLMLKALGLLPIEIYFWLINKSL